MESVGPRFGGCIEVRKIAAIFGGEIRHADFHFADGFGRWLEARATFIILVGVHPIDVVSIVTRTLRVAARSVIRAAGCVRCPDFEGAAQIDVHTRRRADSGGQLIAPR